MRSGHRYSLEKIQYIEIYLGFPEFSRPLHSILLFLNTYSVYIIGLMCLPYCSSTRNVAAELQAVSKRAPITRTSIVLNMPPTSQGELRKDADEEVRRESQSSFRYFVIFSLNSLLAGTIKQISQIFYDKY
jgi:hypothetical protein